jgi:type I site-specific restriction endonuclease
VGFEPTISAGELPQTYALDRMATGTGKNYVIIIIIIIIIIKY